MRMFAAALVLAGSTAHADGIARKLADDGAFTPGVVGARVSASGHATLSAAWSGASDRIAVDAYGEMRVIDRVRLVLHVGDAFGERARPGIGAGVPFLDEARHGIAATAYVMYKAEGFAEPEGEVEATLAFGKQLGAVRTLVGATYGQDPEGNERDAELALAAHVQAVDGWFAGAVVRYRDALGTTKEMFARDAFAGVTSTHAFGDVAFTVMGGVAMVEPNAGVRQVGPAATLTIGAGF